MQTKDWMYKNVFSTMAWIAINSLHITLKIKAIGKEKIDQLADSGEKLIYTFWHGRQFLLVRYLSKNPIVVMSSISRDGILQANILKKFGYAIAFGSSSKSPVRAIIGALQKMRTGYNLAVAIDGPTGPIYKVKPGAIYLAKKTNAFIVPTTFSARPRLTLKSWDKYLLPFPFAQSVMYFGEPFQPSPDLNEKTIQKECDFLEKTLNQITETSDRILLKM